MENLTETKTKEKAKVYSPETLQAINRYLRQGDLAVIAISSNVSYSHVTKVMTGNRGMCLCRNVKSQRIVEEALALIALRKSEAIAKRSRTLEQIKVARAEAGTLQVAISEMEGLLAPQAFNGGEETQTAHPNPCQMLHRPFGLVANDPLFDPFLFGRE